MGYALDINQFIGYKALLEIYSPYATDTDRDDINKSENYTDLMTVVERVMRRYMNDKLGYNGYSAITSYDSSIGSYTYRTVMRLGFLEKNDMKGWQINYSNSGAELNVVDEWDYHWRYQIKDGRWAEKIGELSSHIVSGSGGTINPGASIWKESVNYGSVCKYYAITLKEGIYEKFELDAKADIHLFINRDHYDARKLQESAEHNDGEAAGFSSNANYV